MFSEVTNGNACEGLSLTSNVRLGQQGLSLVPQILVFFLTRTECEDQCLQAALNIFSTLRIICQLAECFLGLGYADLYCNLGTIHFLI